jgi:hypothetical protein
MTKHSIHSTHLFNINDLMQKRKQLLELIAKGERNIKQGKTLSHEKAKDRLTKLK